MSVPLKKLNDGVEIPVLGLGTWEMEEKVCLEAIPLAIDLGYRHIDTAFAYYNEKFIGNAIKSVLREKLFITTKLWREFHDPKRVEEACDKSLMDLGIDHIDLYLIHWPERVNMKEILREMHKLKKKGKVRSVGICNGTVSHIQELLKENIPISVNQVEFHPYLNQSELLSFCAENGVAVTAYCPIAKGAVFKEKTMVEIGKNHDKTPAQISLKWLLQKEMIVIPKGSSMEHLKENIEVFNFNLTENEMKKIDELHAGKRIVLPDFNEFED